MKPATHPPSRHLLAHATGSADVPTRLLVETHLGFCPHCTREVGRFTAPGATILEATPAAPLEERSFERLWERVSRLEPPWGEEEVPLPRALLVELPPPRLWHWHSLLSEGCRMARLLREESSGSTLYVVHLGPGSHFPSHQHHGAEDTLVIAGAVWDGETYLRAGDWNSAEAGTHHTLTAAPVEGCWALARETGDVQLSGWRGALQWAASRLTH